MECRPSVHKKTDITPNTNITNTNTSHPCYLAERVHVLEAQEKHAPWKSHRWMPPARVHVLDAQEKHAPSSARESHQWLLPARVCEEARNCARSCNLRACMPHTGRCRAACHRPSPVQAGCQDPRCTTSTWPATAARTAGNPADILVARERISTYSRMCIQRIRNSCALETRPLVPSVPESRREPRCQTTGAWRKTASHTLGSTPVCFFAHQLVSTTSHMRIQRIRHSCALETRPLVPTFPQCRRDRWEFWDAIRPC
mmetsp:Transcript_45794/g.121470  ORF Transcript_45794/g.121470 Transcript_45794/m.121470 type:complete len:257 (+) Transcript_45794:222-992(+)